MLDTLDIDTIDMTATLEACVEFRPGHDDLLVCSCGWLEDDHGAVLAVVVPVRRRRPTITLPERRAS